MTLHRAAPHNFRASLICRHLTTISILMELSPSSENFNLAEELSLLCTQDRLEEALRVAECTYMQGLPLSKDDFYTLLQACSRSKDLIAGQRVLTLMVKCRLEASHFLGYHLICLFASCGHFKEAYRIFDMILHPNEHTFHAIILACARGGESKRVLELYDRMQEVGIKPDKFVFSSMLNCCDYLGGIEKGKLIHDQIIRCGLQSHLILGNTLIDMYSKCRYLDEALKTFSSMPMKDVVSWGSLIGGYAQHEDFSSALMTYEKMKEDGINPSKVTFLCILKACRSRNALEKGRWIHAEILKSGLDQDVSVGGALVGMYIKCMSLDEAKQVFEALSTRDVVAWGAMITGYSQHECPDFALELFDLLKLKRVKPDVTCFSSSLNACGKMRMPRQGKLIHAEIFERGLESNAVISGALINMYAQCGNLDDAQKVFKDSSEKDVVSHGALISGYVQHGQGVLALHVYAEMQHCIGSPSKFLFSCTLKACSSLGALREGAHLYDQIVRAGLETDTVVGSAIVDMYAKCASILEACKVFAKLRKRDLVSWGAMIVGYVQCGHGYLAYELFKKMQQDGTKPDTYVFSGTLKACGMMGALKAGMSIHAQIIESACELDSVIGSALVDMYVKCRSPDEARQVFEKMPCKNIEAWGAIIAGCTLFGDCHAALQIFNKMLQSCVKPDAFVFPLILKACASLGAELEGMLVHGLTIQSGLVSDVTIGNTLVDMYCKCGRLEDARWEFDKIECPDVLSWSALVVGYCYYDQWVCALELFGSMREKGIKFNKATILSLLKACCNVGAFCHSTAIHEQIVRNNYESDLLLASTLVDTYASCGSLEEAQNVFDNISKQDLVSWGALIGGYAQHGNYKRVGQCFQGFQEQGLKPNDVIFTSLLTACTQTGFVKGACFYFKCMVEDYGLLPDIEQYSCMIDLFGRIGCLTEAEDTLQTMAVNPDIVICTSLLNSCQKHGNLDLGRWCFDQLVRLTPFDAAGYVVISNLYVDAHVWEAVDSWT